MFDLDQKLVPFLSAKRSCHRSPSLRIQMTTMSQFSTSTSFLLTTMHWHQSHRKPTTKTDKDSGSDTVSRRCVVMHWWIYFTLTVLVARRPSRMTDTLFFLRTWNHCKHPVLFVSVIQVLADCTKPTIHLQCRGNQATQQMRSYAQGTLGRSSQGYVRRSPCPMVSYGSYFVVLTLICRLWGMGNLSATVEKRGEVHSF